METGLNLIWMTLKAAGLDERGAFHPVDGDQVADCGFSGGVKTVVLVGNVGGAMWPTFEAGRRDEVNALDQWTERVLSEIIEILTPAYGDISPIYPSDGPPYHPFQQWAMGAETVFSSPIGLLIHPDHGLWHAYRGALLFERKLDIPECLERPNPCDTCSDKPCLTTCPVGAFSPGHYDVQGCANHLTTRAGDVCLAQGCLARHACPVGFDNAYRETQARFHMSPLRDKYAT
jgi:ferredoxin